MSSESTKTCSHCGAVVPGYAVKCKHCFGDLMSRLEPSPRPPWTWLGLTLVMALACGATVSGVLRTQALAQVTLDDGSQSVVLVYTRYSGTPNTRRVPYGEIAKIELVNDATIFGTTSSNVFVVTGQGERILINTSKGEDLTSYAEGVVMRTKKPLVNNNKARIGTTVLDGSASTDSPSP